MPYPMWAVLVAVAWGAVVCLLAELQVRVLRIGVKGRSLGAMIEVALLMSYALSAAVPWATRYYAGSPPPSALHHVVITLGSVGLVGFAAFEVVGLRHFRAYGGGPGTPVPLLGRLRLQSGNVGATLMIVTASNVPLVMFMPSPREPGLLALVVAFVASFSVLLAQRCLAGFGARGGTVSFEDAPMHDELRSIAAFFGWDRAAFSLLTTRDHADAGDVPSPSRVAFALRAWLFDVRRPTLPIELVQAVEPMELSAIVAQRYSLMTPFSPGRPYRSLLLYLGFTATGLLVSVLLCVLGMRALGSDPAWLFIWTFGLYSFAVAIPFPKWSGLIRTADYTHRRAFEAWSAAAPGRTFDQYAHAMATRERLMLQLGSGADLDALAWRDPGLIRASEIVQSRPPRLGPPAAS